MGVSSSSFSFSFSFSLYIYIYIYIYIWCVHTCAYIKVGDGGSLLQNNRQYYLMVPIISSSIERHEDKDNSKNRPASGDHRARTNSSVLNH